ncbi:MAG: hypothetical protein HFJ80_01605 [Clostridiales bacterium]|nr:hypothetical protein [Clostridiales bacterium]
MKKNSVVRLTESGIMLAFAIVLSLVKLVDLPYGGSITLCSMLPVLIIAYRYGTAWGLFTASAFGVLQMLTGMSSVRYGTSFLSVSAIVLFDFLLAFAVLGLGGVFRGKVRGQGAALMAGSLLACVLRYLCHTLVGCTVWAGLSIPTQDALLYSLAYNATYMVPETIITLLGACYLSRVLDFGSENITRVQPQSRRPDLQVLFSGIAKTLLAAAAVWDLKEIAFCLQGDEGFDITGIQQVNWLSVGIATAAAAALAALFFLLCRRVPSDSRVSLSGLFSALPFLGVGAAAVGAGFFIRNMLNKLTQDTEELLQELLGGELGAHEAAKAFTDAASNRWLSILVIGAAVIAALVLAGLRYAARKKSA